MSEVVVYRKRRGVEAILLLFSVALAMSGYLLTHLDIDSELPPQWPWALGIFTLLALVAHIVVRWRIPYADPVILPLVMLLNGIGLAMIHRLDLGTNVVTHSAERQLTWLVVAVIGFCLIVVFLRNYEVLHRFPYLLFLLGLALLMMPIVPGIGRENHGSQIWINLPGGLSLQPAEIAKIVLCVAFAAYLVDRREVLASAGPKLFGIELPRPRDLGPILIMWLASMAIMVFQKDLGTSLLFFSMVVSMLYIATERAIWPALGTLLFASGATAAYFAFSHVRVRVSSWLDPFSNYDQNYQIITGQFGINWGGAVGTGWGMGRPNLTPLAKTDFIAAAIGEELGLAGLAAVMLVYAIIVARGMRAALGSQEPFGKLLAAGLSFTFAIQVFSILGGVTRLLPLTGLTTPFMSQGGSSLIANWAMMAILLIITHYARRPQQIRSDNPVMDFATDSTMVLERQGV